MIGYLCFFSTLALIYGVATLGLNLQWGAAGLFNVGVAGFAAIGGYVSAWITAAPADSHWGGFGLPIALGWAGAMAGSALAAWVVGVATLRLRADYLAITTFGAAVSVQLVALNAQSLTGGPFGIAFIPQVFPVRPGATLALVACVVGLIFWGLERLTRSPWGRALRAIREDEVAAGALGKAADRLRVQAFVIGAALMGLSGAMQAQVFGFISPDNYLPVFTFQVWVMLVIGGAGNNVGALLGAFLVWGVWTLSGTAAAALLSSGWQARGAALRVVGIGVVLAATLLLRPRGVAGERMVVSRHLD